MVKKWKVIKEWLLLSKNNGNIAELNSNGKLLNNEQEISDDFKMLSETCASKLAENFPNWMDTSSIMTQGGNLWNFEHTHEGEIIKITKLLMNKSSSRSDSLTSIMWYTWLLQPLITVWSSFSYITKNS